MKKTFLMLVATITLHACGENDKNGDTATASPDDVEETSTENPVPEPIPAESTSGNYSYEVVVSDMQIPWGFTFLPDGSMLITEKSGDIIHFKDGNKQQIKGVPEVYDRGQGGLLDIVLHPDYENNGWIYISYASPEGSEEGGNTAIMRAKLENGSFTNKEVLYKAGPNTTKGQHFGSRIVFDKEGYLYFSSGDRGARDENPQDITRDNGKIYRLNDDGSIPDDNPFTDNDAAKKAIFSYGHRNPQGIILNPETGEVWVHEHGPQGGDEINVIKRGENYGWPEVTYGENYGGGAITDQTSNPEMEDPIFYWLPSIAPSGMAYITSNKFPDLKGDLLVGSLKFQYIEHLTLNGKKVEKRERILEDIGRVRDIRQGQDGEIYAAIEGTGIIKLTTEE
ncbi:PQQ-dependent sugar dehydrogenase [Salegentibacter sp. F188]|uniref:PQQ-dependent sugar dehydrogenase n=1 Tax=Autumnicola patrickiae TaxID=3075591 RepID=A0ABU3DX90_9FLAO|nr:PQQ-dependent sugar dehydrogenase [Salegentibacter sp. F188]MDT0688331.1 PQQ-dependent sugar dehydrogenase [Salegentibacter sp. F188]